MKKLRFVRICLLLVALLGLPVLAAPDWEKLRFEVSPDEGVEGLNLNEALPESWPARLGAPTSTFHYHDTGEGYRRLFWGKVEKGQLVRGLTILAMGEGEDSSILEVCVRRVRATVKDSDLFLGLEVERLAKRSKMVQKDGTTSFQLPGILLEATDGKVSGLVLVSTLTTRWRFTRWVVRPGSRVGPVHLDEPLSERVIQAIGKPHHETREEVSWSSAGGAQQIVIRRDARTLHVTHVKGEGIPWKTDRGVTVGDTLETYKAKHPEAREGVGRTFDQPVMKAPGLRATFDKGKLVSFDLFPIPKH